MSTNTQYNAKTISRADKARRPRASTAATRERIIEAAMAVFANRGYSNSSLLEIAERANMTHAGVLHHFGSKDNLLTAVLAHRDDADVAELHDHKLPTGKAMLEHLVDTARVNAKRPGIVQTYTVLSAESITEDHPAQDFFRDRLRGLRIIIGDALRDVVPATVSEVQIDRAASVIVATMDGLQVQWLLEPDVIDMAAGVDATIAAVVTQLNASPPNQKTV